MLLGIGAGLLVGLVNGSSRRVFRINALIATLAMSFIVSGASSLVTGGNLLVLFDKPGFGTARPDRVPDRQVVIWLMIVAVVVHRLPALGHDGGALHVRGRRQRRAARLAGVRVDASACSPS